MSSDTEGRNAGAAIGGSGESRSGIIINVAVVFVLIVAVVAVLLVAFSNLFIRVIVVARNIEVFTGYFAAEAFFIQGIAVVIGAVKGGLIQHLIFGIGLAVIDIG